MTRENKAGLVVASSFLALLGIVLTIKMRELPEGELDAAASPVVSLPGANGAANPVKDVPPPPPSAPVVAAITPTNEPKPTHTVLPSINPTIEEDEDDDTPVVEQVTPVTQPTTGVQPPPVPPPTDIPPPLPGTSSDEVPIPPPPVGEVTPPMPVSVLPVTTPTASPPPPVTVVTPPMPVTTPPTTTPTARPVVTPSPETTQSGPPSSLPPPPPPEPNASTTIPLPPIGPETLKEAPPNPPAPETINVAPVVPPTETKPTERKPLERSRFTATPGTSLPRIGTPTLGAPRVIPDKKTAPPPTAPAEVSNVKLTSGQSETKVVPTTTPPPAPANFDAGISSNVPPRSMPGVSVTIPDTQPNGGRPVMAKATTPLQVGMERGREARTFVEHYKTSTPQWFAEDTWASVSKKYFNSPDYAEALRAFNQQNPQISDRLPQDGLPNPGDTVMIPPLWVLEKYHKALIRETKK